MSYRSKSIISLLCPLIFSWFLFNFVIGIAVVNGSSMEPTLYDGDRLVFLRIYRSYEYGDIVVIQTDNGYLVKRIIATEGQTIDFISWDVFVDDEILFEEYIACETIEQDVIMPHKVSQNSYFVMGDNRINSLDSRFSVVGDIEKGQIVGKVILKMSQTDIWWVKVPEKG